MNLKIDFPHFLSSSSSSSSSGAGTARFNLFSKQNSTGGTNREEDLQDSLLHTLIINCSVDHLPHHLWPHLCLSHPPFPPFEMVPSASVFNSHFWNHRSHMAMDHSSQSLKVYQGCILAHSYSHISSWHHVCVH